MASRRAAIVAPGGSGHPPMTTRVGSPSVCESTTDTSRMACGGSVPIREPFADQRADHLALIAGQLHARRAYHCAPLADLLLHELDQLNELGNGVEAQQGQEPMVERACRFGALVHREVEELHRFLRECVRE